MVLSKKIIFTAAASVLMFAQVAASRAVTFTLNVPSGISSPASTFITGINSVNNIYTAQLTPASTTLINNASTVSYGTTQISPNSGNGANTSDTFNNAPATFTFDVIANGVTNRFFVSGVIRDVAGGTSVDANGNGGTGDDFIAQSIRVNGGATYTNVVSSPNQRTSVVANNIQFGSTFANIYVEQLNGLTAPTNNPNFSNTLTVGGYIGVVPEPGALAMMMGAGISGVGLLSRRRRARVRV